MHQQERVFSLMNNLWTSEKSGLKPETVKQMLITKCNLDCNCLEFHDILLGNRKLLKAIHSSEKYVVAEPLNSLTV